MNILSKKLAIKNNRVKTLMYCLLVLSIPLNASGIRNFKLAPVITQFQYAGNLGLVSAGIGKPFFNEKLDVFLIYGYLPKDINGADVNTFAMKTSLRFAKTKFLTKYSLDYYTGGMVFYSIAKNTYTEYPGYFPDGYYETNAIHASFHAGTRLNRSLSYINVKMISVFTEFGALDSYIYYAFKNKYIGFKDIWNFCFGIAFTFF